RRGGGNRRTARPVGDLLRSGLLPRLRLRAEQVGKASPLHQVAARSCRRCGQVGLLDRGLQPESGSPRGGGRRGSEQSVVARGEAEEGRAAESREKDLFRIGISKDDIPKNPKFKSYTLKIVE